MKVRNIKTEENFDNMHDIEKAAQLRSDETAKIIMMKLQPGDVVKEHTTPYNVSFFVHKGEIVMKIGDESQKVKEGDLIQSPSNIVHSFTNEASQNAQVMVVKHINS